jgi:hypothetical protein
MARQLRSAARELEQPAAEHGGLVRMVYGWERGDHDVSERYALLYAKALGVSPDDLANGPAKPGVSSVLPVVGSEDGDDPVKRREFGFAALGALVGTLVPLEKVPASVSPEHVSELRRTSEQLCSSDWNVGGSALLHQAKTLYTSARNLLDNSTYTPAVGTDLQVMTAELAANAGFIAFDADEQRLARFLFTEAALLVGGAGDPLVTADIFSLLALQSTNIAASAGNSRVGLAREALRFLDQAVSAARYEPSPKVHAIIAMRRARAYGLLGDEREVRTHISAARRELDRGDHPSDPHWTAFVTQAEVTAHEAISWLALNQADNAAMLFREVLDDDVLPARNRALYQAQLATSLAAAGDRKEAIAEGMRVLPTLEGEVRSARTVNQLRPVRQGENHDTEFAVRFDALAAAS